MLYPTHISGIFFRIMEEGVDKVSSSSYIMGMWIIPEIRFYDGELEWHEGEEWECMWVRVVIEGEERIVAPAAFSWYDGGLRCWIDVGKQGYWPKTLTFLVHELVHWGIWLCGNFGWLHDWHDNLFRWVYFH